MSIQKGRQAEKLVCQHLLQLGYRIAGTNIRVGPLELDIVATKGSTVIFCEVRARREGAFVSAIESIGMSKRRRLREAAARYLNAEGLHGRIVRFDVAAITLCGHGPELDYRENAF